MKKYILFLIFGFIFLMPCVNAVGTNIIFNSSQLKFEEITNYCTNGCGRTYDQAKQDLLKFRDEVNYPYYLIYYSYAQSHKLWMIEFDKNDTYVINASLDGIYIDFENCKHTFSTGSDHVTVTTENTAFGDFDYILSRDGNVSIDLIESNYDFVLEGANYEIQNFYKDSIILNSGSILPTYEKLKNYNSWSDYLTENNPKYTTVNLNDYAYVLLSLKDYSNLKQFKTIMSVKGQLCLSAGYNYGVSDRTNGVTDSCSAVYNDFTDLDVYVLESDIVNNAVYYLTGYNKEIDNIVKVDSSIFDIHYITEKNKDNPIITVNGKDYNVIPYYEMKSNATKNTDAGIVSGSSCKVGDLNCQANTPHNSTGTFEDVVKNISSSLSSIWDTFVYFIGFITKMFSTLPVEFRTISITTFTVGCVLGLIKILKS